MEIKNIKRTVQISFGIILILSLLQIGPFKPMIDEVSAESSWVQTTDLDFYNGTLNNLTILGSGEDAELRLKLNNWWTNKKMPNRPKPRKGHAMAAVYGTDKIILFGGIDNNDYCNDTWVYDLSNNSWTKKNPPSSPEARYEHTMATIYGDDKVLLHGGGGDILGSYGDTWVYDLSNDTWTLQTPFGPQYQLHAMASIYETDTVVIYGSGYLNNDTWVYNLNQNNWTLKNQTSKPNGRREHAMASISGTNKIILFSGIIGGTPSNWIYDNDTWIFNLNKNEWYEQFLTMKPCARSDHAMASIFGTEKVILFGGNNGKSKCGDSWAYNLKDNTWTEIKASNQPNARSGHAMASFYGTDKVLLFGGDDGDFNDESWIYEQFLDIINGMFISSPFDTATISSFNTISWTADVSIGTTIKFQLRTAVNKTNLNSSPFVGPDGTKATFYESSPSNICADHDGDRWVQYKVYFITTNNDVTPILKEIIINYNCVPAAPDLIAPANNIWTNDNTPLFNWSFNDLDSKQAVFQVLIDNDNEFNSIDYDSDEQTSGNNYWQFPIGTNYNSISDGTWYWKVRTRDNDGDWGVYSTSYKLIIDTKSPNSKIIVPKDNEYYNYLDVISGTASDTGKGSIVSKVEIAIYSLNDNSYWNGSNWAEEESWLLASGTTDWLYDSISINWSSCHQYQIRSQATDNATNIEIPGNGNTFYFDSDDPISTIENPKNNSWLNHLNIISGSANDPEGSGIDRVEICIKNINFGTYWDGKSWVEIVKWVTASQTETWSYNTSNIKWSTDTEYYVNSRASDKVGNKEFPGPKNIFRFDYKPPEQLSILINDGAEYTNSTQVRLSLHAEDSLCGINQMAFSTNNIKWSVWELFNTTKSFTLLAGDGKKAIYFKVRDYANNTAVPISDSIILDTIPPYNLSILINNGTSETDSIYIILKLNATDDTSGIYKMSFSTDGNNWSDWENFTDTKSYILSDGDGVKTIYFKVKDRAGNFGESVETNITLTTLDTDNDGYPDSTDAFPNNPQYHLDTDSDGMPDAWENKYGLNKYDPSDANVDSDNDGKSNLDEFIDGTDPTEKNVKDGKEEDYVGYIIGAIIVLIIIIFLYILKSRRDDKSKEDKIGKAKSSTKLPSDKSQEKACEDERI